jgi:hypothetical protein
VLGDVVIKQQEFSSKATASVKFFWQRRFLLSGHIIHPPLRTSSFDLKIPRRTPVPTWNRLSQTRPSGHLEMGNELISSIFSEDNM